MIKKWTIKTMIALVIALIITASITIIVDPFFHYHQPISNNGYAYTNETYQNPGIAKNFDYDSVIIGSSMAQNFKPSEIDELFDVNSVKLTYAGGTAHNFKEIMDIVSENPNVKKVFYTLDPYSVTKPIDETRMTLPRYLYDESILNDVEYVFNKNVLLEDTYVYARRNNENPSRDDAFSWQERYSDAFVPSMVIDLYNKNAPSTTAEMKDEEIYKDIVTANMNENIIPFIENNPDTEFYISFPPYSILEYAKETKEGVLIAGLWNERYIISRLLEHENVKVFYFKDIKEIICDLNNYKDYTHYSQDINSFMAQAMENDEYRITSIDYEQRIDDFKEYLLNYDYQALIDKYSS